MNHKKLSALIVTILFCSGCDATPTTPSIALPEFVTATLPATSAPITTQTSPSPTTAPTIAPLAGTTTSEVNVRVDTSTASESLGTIPAFSTVQIVGKDISGIWFRILYNNDAGWVRADYVQVSDVTAEIPVWGAETGSGSAGRGVILRGVYVRSGPGKDFDSLGLLNQNDVVSILGKDSSGAWMKIAYPASADGTGWVAAEYLQIDNAGNIPTLDEATEVTATNTPESSSSVPAQTALTDGDTADAPLAIFVLSPAAVRAVQFQGEVSAADGEDWIGFSSQSDDVVIQVLCESGGIKVELLQTAAAPSLMELDCGGVQNFQITEGQNYFLRILPVLNSDQTSIKYELKIKVSE
ncbi:MAG: SH3 domain-containing protein [Chloroflexi bacterium]|nr:SH3 domain-containing protein [Chloroflexota bacterium]